MNNSSYYYHTTLSALSQDELYAILFFGGLASLVLFTVAPMALTMHFVRHIDEHRGESIFGVVVGTLAKIIFWATMYLMFIVFFYTLYIYAIGGSSGMSPAESMEWFFHTDWITKLPELSNSLDAIREYGEDAERIGKDVVVSIYLVRLAFTFVMLGFALLVTFSVVLKINKLVNAQSVNSVEYSSTLIAGAVAGILALVLVIGMIDLAIGEIFSISDKFAGTSVSVSPVKIEMVYLDVLNPDLLFKTTNMEVNSDPL